MSWNDLFVNMDNTNFFNFSFLPKYASAFLRGFEYTLLLAVVSVLLAVTAAAVLFWNLAIRKRSSKDLMVNVLAPEAEDALLEESAQDAENTDAEEASAVSAAAVAPEQNETEEEHGDHH